MNEKQLQKLITEHLTFLRNMGKLFFLRANAGFIPVTYKAKNGQNRSFGVRLAPKGTSDLILFLPTPKTLFLELKGLGKKQSPEQKEFQQLITKLGFEYHLLDDYEDFVALLKANKI